MEERRAGRVGTVSGLGLLAGCTAVAAVAGGSHSAYSTVMLGLLTLGLGHSLTVELRRQARRRSAAGWSRHDTVNAVLLGVWSEAATVFAIWGTGRPSMQIVGVALAVAYAVACAHFVTQRRRAVAAQLSETPPAGHATARETTASDAPPQETTASDPPPQKTLAADAPAQKTAAADAPTRKTAAADAPARKTLAADAPTRETAEQDAPARETAEPL